MGKVRRGLLLRLGSGGGGGSCVEVWARGEWRVERGNGKKRGERGLGVCGLRWRWRWVQKQITFVVSGVFVGDNLRICVFWVGGKVVGCENAGEACT